MPQTTICKTVHQYNKEPVSQEDMQKLQEIAEDYRSVKNYVYQRYGGIGSLPKLYPGYTVQNEMTQDGLRARLGLPSVYFYLAVFDALGDIKSQWAHVRNKLSVCIKENAGFTPQDRHYLRFAIKMSQCFEAILLNEEMHLEGEWQAKYDALAAETDTRKMDQYLRRQVRKYLKKMHTDTADGFSISERAYRYGDHGIYIATKEKRKRVFVPLTDNNHYKKQLYIMLHPDEGNIEIRVPIEMAVKIHENYEKEIGIAMGMRQMFVTDEGHVYGGEYGTYQQELVDYIGRGMKNRQQQGNHNPGRKKYHAGKARLEAGLHTYVNAEINRMLAEEKPGIIYIPKLPRTSKAGVNKKINRSVTLWQKGYVKNRLVQKCTEHSVELVEVYGNQISTVCSQCGGAGGKKGDVFVCEICGVQMPDRVNAAKNARNRGRDGEKVVRS